METLTVCVFRHDVTEAWVAQVQHQYPDWQVTHACVRRVDQQGAQRHLVLSDFNQISWINSLSGACVGLYLKAPSVVAGLPVDVSPLHTVRAHFEVWFEGVMFPDIRPLLDKAVRLAHGVAISAPRQLSPPVDVAQQDAAVHKPQAEQGFKLKRQSLKTSVSRKGRLRK